MNDTEQALTVLNLPLSVATPVVVEENYTGDLPEPGGSWPYGDWQTCDVVWYPQNQATHVVIELATWSDYSGNAVERSNYRSLLRDYPDTFTDVRGGYDTYALLLSVDWTPPEDGREGLLEELSALADYPLYDEEDYSALEMELADEAWDAYLKWNVPSYLAADHGVSEEALEGVDEEILREAFYRITGEQPEYPYGETAVDVHFPYLTETIAQMARELFEV
jgi:hypothetical protein